MLPSSVRIFLAPVDTLTTYVPANAKSVPLDMGKKRRRRHEGHKWRHEGPRTLVLLYFRQSLSVNRVPTLQKYQIFSALPEMETADLSLNIGRAK